MEGGGEENMEVVDVVAKTLDKSKRDEWSEGGVTSLLDAYETKWLIRDRAKLKGSDWEDIARQVSFRGCGTNPVKTPNQCKNKIEAMKKRYRVKSAVNSHSGSGQSWQYYARMDKLMKGSKCLRPKVGDVVANGVAGTGSWQDLPNVAGNLQNDKKKLDDFCPKYVQAVEEAQNCKTVDADGTKKLDDFCPKFVQAVEEAQNCKTIDVDGLAHLHDSNRDDGSNVVPSGSEFCTPPNKAADVGVRLLKTNSFKLRKSLGSSVAKSIRMLGHSMLKIEQARMEMYRDSERMRAAAEIKRAEMDFKRTEIIAKTQLQIAKLFVKRMCIHNSKSGNSSLVGENIAPTNMEENKG